MDDWDVCYKEQNRIRKQNRHWDLRMRQVCIMHCAPLACTLVFYFSPPGSVCWWGLPKRTPPSPALWRLGPSTTAPGPATPTAADRYLLTIPVSNLKAFFFFQFFPVMDQNKFMTDLLGAPLGIIMFHTQDRTREGITSLLYLDILSDVCSTMSLFYEKYLSE